MSRVIKSPVQAMSDGASATKESGDLEGEDSKAASSKYEQEPNILLIIYLIKNFVK